MNLALPGSTGRHVSNQPLLQFLTELLLSRLMQKALHAWSAFNIHGLDLALVLFVTMDVFVVDLLVSYKCGNISMLKVRKAE
jgi:hypothetical protein